jgi:F-type H+-transporting ATPase subunit b
MQAVILLILIFLMIKFAWKPIMASLDDREQGIQNALDAAEDAKKEMQNLKADNEKFAQEARAERETMLKEAREMKETMLASAKEEATVEASKIMEKAQASIVAEKNAAIADIKSQVASISIGIAEKVVRENLSSDDKQMQLVAQMLKDISIN